MYSEFHLRAGALDQNFLNGIKTIFRNKPISVYVEEDMDETEYLLRSPANRKMLLESIKQADRGELITVNIEKNRKK